MAHTEERMFAAMERIQAKEIGWEGHMFVLPTDYRISAAAREPRSGSRVIEDDEVILMCRDDSTGATRWVEPGLNHDREALLYGPVGIRDRAEAAVAAASSAARRAVDVASRSHVIRDAYRMARAARMLNGRAVALV